MEIMDVIKYNGRPDVFAWKYPGEELGTWSQLVVNQSQEAVLVKGGSVADVFGPGTHTLDTKNIPILNKIINLPFGGKSPFKAEVWYINKGYYLDIKWGTPTPIQIQDPKYGIFIPIRSNGAFGIHVTDSVKFLTKLVTTMNVFDAETVTKYFRSLYVTKIKDTISSYLLHRKINMDSLQKQISTAMSSYMGQAMSAYTGAISQAISTQMTSAMSQVTTQLAGGLETVMTSAMSRIGENLQKALGGSMNFNADAFANAFQFNMTEDDLTELMMSMSGAQSASCDNNLQQLGYADFSQPSSISIYPKDFDNKEKVVEVLDHYNQKMEDEGKEEQVISYTDIVGTMMSSVTTIINTISYVLIAFVAISLLVSSIMIGVITYISVLERKKEIGILRAIGASKGNISQVFNAETFIIGLCAGLIGIGLTLLILIPGNMLIHALADNNRVSAILPIAPAIVLILLSVVLTLLGGLIPSRKAAKSDPVTALRTE